LNWATDILRTPVTPTWNDIEQLAAIAALRTALNYFLGKDIEKEAPADQRRAEQAALGSDESRLKTETGNTAKRTKETEFRPALRRFVIAC